METVVEDHPRLSALADRLDCLTEADMIMLADVTPKTLEAWRKRGDGPAYIRAGTRYLYQRKAVAQWLDERVHERCSRATSKAGL